MFGCFLSVDPQIAKRTVLLQPLRSGAPPISAEEIAQIDADWLKWREEWIRRKKTFNSSVITAWIALILQILLIYHQVLATRNRFLTSSGRYDPFRRPWNWIRYSWTRYPGEKSPLRRYEEKSPQEETVDVVWTCSSMLCIDMFMAPDSRLLQLLCFVRFLHCVYPRIPIWERDTVNKPGCGV